MPIPNPNPGESFDKFIERCMSDENMLSEYPQDQRYAICSMKFNVWCFAKAGNLTTKFN